MSKGRKPQRGSGRPAGGGRAPGRGGAGGKNVGGKNVGGKGGAGNASAGKRSAGKTGAGKSAARGKPAEKVVFDAPKVADEPRTFRLGVIPGATPGKWISVWRDRMPAVPLELVHLSVADQRAALLAGDVDAAIVRLPIDRDDLGSIALYDEVPVVVVSIESALTAADELTAADLAGEVVIVPEDDVLAIGPIDGTQAARFAPPATTADAIATVASGVGVTIVPMSLARLHHRKDVDYRPLTDGPRSSVTLAWHADRQTVDVDTFIGIVRGRTANSSRG